MRTGRVVGQLMTAPGVGGNPTVPSAAGTDLARAGRPAAAAPDARQTSARPVPTPGCTVEPSAGHGPGRITGHPQERPMTTLTTTPPAARGIGNPVRGRFNSWFFDLLGEYLERRLGDDRRELLSELDGVVAEIGAGNGATFRHLRRGIVVHAIEPNPYFHRRLDAEARRRGIELVLH